MNDEQARYRLWYRRLLRFYSRSHRERFGESMEQTFTDLCRERIRAGRRGFVVFISWIFFETFASIIRERVTNLARLTVATNVTAVLKAIKYSAIVVGVLMLAGIITLMILARGTGEDIAGIVAPALLLTILSAVAAVVAAIMQKRRNASSTRSTD